MGRTAQEYLIKRDEKSPYWYYRLKGWKNFKSTGFKTKSAALKFIFNELEKFQENERLNNQIKFNEFTIDLFKPGSFWYLRQMRKQRLQSSTIDWRNAILINHILPRFSNFYISDIKARQIDQFLLS